MQNPFGSITPPQTAITAGTPGEAIGKLIQQGIWLLIIGAGIYSVFNIIIAGYYFMGAGEDPKKISAAWGKIWQTALGLAVAAGSFVLAAIFGQLIFGSPDFILNPQLPKL